MAGSRLEKVGTIFNRVNGLLRSGALDPADRPLWFDVYRKFPPKVEPKYERAIPSQELRQIIYPEDLIRMNFDKLYGDFDVISFKNESIKTTSQLFVETYIELLNTEENRTDLFKKTAEFLIEQGLRIKNVKEVKEVHQGNSEEIEKKKTYDFSIADIFGDIPNHMQENEFDDTDEKE